MSNVLNELIETIIDERIKQNYDLFSNFEEICRGPFGTVRKATWGDKTVVLKSLNIDTTDEIITKNEVYIRAFVNELQNTDEIVTNNEVYIRAFVNELQKLITVDEHEHPNIVKFYGVTKDLFVSKNDLKTWGSSRSNYEKAIKRESQSQEFQIEDYERIINSVMDNIDNRDDQMGVDIPDTETRRKKILKTSSGLGYNVNHIIGAGIFITPSNVWRLAQSPGSALMLWISGGLISLFGSMIYVELGSRFPEGSGEQKYLEETIILPGAIIADSYACSKYILYAFKGNSEDEGKYFGIDYIELRILAIAILLIITGYNVYSNKLAIRINQTFAVIKVFALIIISIIGLVSLREDSKKDHWKGIFNNTPSDDAHERSVSEQIGSYGNAMLNVLFSYEGWNNLNYLTEELDSPEQSLKISAVLSVPGRIIISILISISAFGCVGSMVFMGARAIAYTAKYKFIPRISRRLYYWGATPVYALLLQFVYCAFLILLAPVGTSFFPFFSDMSQYLAMVFYGVSAICLLIIKKKLKDAEYAYFKQVRSAQL
ncbi:9407_t:CDS:10 [Dentiscutata erythropus]|uniref:9407_t:CDS:1 n=1 Tax=Dentiscutata erythropus TaxID=1348616 RepID=A0A9N8ZFD1_9GLOM|nr:9407_t:CDS:10 [Dentiscutata erythropus]